MNSKCRLEVHVRWEAQCVKMRGFDPRFLTTAREDAIYSKGNIIAIAFGKVVILAVERKVKRQFYFMSGTLWINVIALSRSAGRPSLTQRLYCSLSFEAGYKITFISCARHCTCNACVYWQRSLPVSKYGFLLSFSRSPFTFAFVVVFQPKTHKYPPSRYCLTRVTLFVASGKKLQGMKKTLLMDVTEIHFYNFVCYVSKRESISIKLHPLQ